MTFRIVAILALLLTIVLLPLQRTNRGAEPYRPVWFPWWQRLFYAVMLLGMVGLAVTGFCAGIFQGRPMEHWQLIAHVMFAPAFAVGMAVVALAFAERRSRSPSGRTGEVDGPQKFLFWLMLMLSLVAILSAVLPMLPLPAQHDMHRLYNIHRYSSLFFFMIAILHAKRFRSWRKS